MKIIDNILGRAGYVSKEKATSPSVSGSGSSDPFVIWRQTKKIDPQKAMDVYTGWTYACIRAIAEELGSMKLKLYKIGKERDEEIYDHELLDLLSAVNMTQTGLELFYLTGAHLEAVGNAYWYLEGVKSEKGKPTAIHIMNPARTKVLADRNDFPVVVDGYQLKLQSKNKSFKQYEILHLKYPDPSDSVEGIGTVQSIAQWIDQDNYATEFNRRFFLNGARIGGFIESESAYTPEQLEYLKKSFENIYTGVENAHQVAALPKGTKYTEGGKTQKDLDFANLLDKMRDHILAGFRVPRTVLGITDDVNRANAEATNYVFALRTVKPKMELIVAQLNEFLVPRYGNDIYLSFEDPVPENREATREDRKVALGGQPYKSVNEVREEDGLNPIDNGDTVMGDFNKLPVGKPQKPQKQAQPRKRTRAKVMTRHARAAKVRKGLAEAIAEKTTEALKTVSKKIKKDITTLSDDEYEVVWRAFNQRQEEHSLLLEERLRQFNSQQKSEVMENLAAATKEVDRDALFESEKWVSILIDLATPIALDLFDKEAQEAGKLIGVEVEPITPETREAIIQSMELMSEAYNEETLNLLEEKLTQGQADGLSLNQLEDLVKDIYEFSDDVRAVRLARTETFRIANYATKEAWRQSGVVKTLRWYTTRGTNVCQFCQSLDGKVIDIDKDFFAKGDEVDGVEGGKMKLNYADVGAPPLHPNCNCYTRPEEISID